jgi:hypothetical protein
MIISVPINLYYIRSYIINTHHPDEIYEAILDGKIFGAVECDLKVPEYLKWYFEEMTPIFKHATVKHADIGEHMQEFVKEANIHYSDRKYLIGSMFAEKVLVITPLLRWYVEHGVTIEKIHQVIQFKPER